MIDDVQRRLARRFGQLSADAISAAVAEAHGYFEHSRVRDFIPLLVERRAAQQLSRTTDLIAATR